MITYDVLVREALDSYHDYLEADDRVARLNDILAKIGDKVEEAAAAGDADVAAAQATRRRSRPTSSSRYPKRRETSGTRAGASPPQDVCRGRENGTPSNEPNVADDGRRFQFGLAQPLARTSGATL